MTVQYEALFKYFGGIRPGQLSVDPSCSKLVEGLPYKGLEKLANKGFFLDYVGWKDVAVEFFAEMLSLGEDRVQRGKFKSEKVGTVEELLKKGKTSIAGMFRTEEIYVYDTGGVAPKDGAFYTKVARIAIRKIKSRDIKGGMNKAKIDISYFKKGEEILRKK